MKKKITFITLTLLLGLITWSATAQTQVTVAGSATGNGNYYTLGEAITAIPLSGQEGNNITVAINASTTEVSSGITIGAGTWSSLKIYPTATVTLAAAANTSTTAFIILSGANKVTIDGRLNQSGVSSLTIDNVSTAGTNGTTAGSTITFTSNAQNNTVKYCTIKGRQGGAFGIISFSATADATNGNGLNVIDHNIITNNGGPVLYGLYAIGNTAKPNIGNQITNNEFKDILNTTLASNVLFILGGVSAPQNDNFTISGNSLYNVGLNVTAGGSRQMIAIGSGSAPYGGSHTIKDNFIGSTAANCSGTNIIKYSTSSNFNGIYISTSPSTVGGGSTSIQNNTIQKISWQNGSNANFIGIYVGGTGNANIGTITGNTIGDNTTTGSIVCSNFATGNTTGISIANTAGTVDCQKNKIGSINVYNGTAAVAAPINVIQKTATAGNVIISNNIIGSTTTNNSIYAYNKVGANPIQAAAVAQNVYPILCQGTGTNTISNNTIANVTNFTTIGNLYAIYLNGTGSTSTVNGNLIHSITTTGYTGTGALMGIQSLAGINTITNNIIKLGDNNACQIRGISDGTSTTTGAKIYHNTVYISGAPTSGSFISACIHNTYNATQTAKDYRNNIVVNARSNSVDATGEHYAFYITSNTATGLTIDGNNYYASGTGGYALKIGTNPSQNTLPSFSGKDVASYIGNPSFANTSGTTPESFVPSSLLLTGVDLLATVGLDYNGVNRTTTPTMGAHDYRVYNGGWNTTPTTDYNARIDGTYTGAGFACRNLVVNAGKQLSINTGILAVANNFTILSDATNGTGTFIDNGGTLSVTGTTTVNQSLQHYLTGTLRTWYLTPPVASATPSGMSIIKSYDEPTYTWSSSLTTMNAKVGYQVVPALAANNISFTGALNTGNQNISLTSRTGIANKAGFNLIGNPYPSYLDWDLVTAANTTQMRTTTMWYRTKSDAGTYNYWTVNGDGVVSPNGANSKIPPMQAFWVRANAGGGTLALTNDMRSHAPVTDKLLKAPAVKNTANTLVRLQVSNGTNTDEAVLYFSANASNGLDSYDAPKMSNEDAAIPEIYTTLGDEQIVINGMNTIPLDAPIGLGFVAGNASSFSLFANEVSNLPSGIKLILKDNVTNAETDLTDGIATYQFSPVLTSSDRFSVIFRTPGAVTSVENPQDNSILVYNNAPQQLTVICNDLINLGSMVSVYNALGQKLISQKQTATCMQIAGKFIPGVYVVKVNNTTKKVIIN